MRSEEAPRLATFPTSVTNCGFPAPSVSVLRRRTSGRHTAGTQFRHADTHPAAGAAVGRAGAQLQPFDESRPADDRVRRRPGRPHAVLDDRLSVTADGPVRDRTRRTRPRIPPAGRPATPYGEPRRGADTSAEHDDREHAFSRDPTARFSSVVAFMAPRLHICLAIVYMIRRTVEDAKTTFYSSVFSERVQFCFFVFLRVITIFIIVRRIKKQLENYRLASNIG